MATRRAAAGRRHARPRRLACSCALSPLLDAVADELPNWPDTGGNYAIGFAAAELHALRDERADALRVLRAALDRDTWTFWRWRLLLNGNFNSLREDPEFQAIVASLEERMARERRSIEAP